MGGAFVFDLHLDHGHCVGLRLDDSDAGLDARLLPEESAHAAAMTPHRRTAFVGGRAALREALARCSIESGPILATPRGAPALPPGASGSISHKETIAVGLAAVSDGYTRGVDVEYDRPPRGDIARLVLTEAERAEVDVLDFDARGRELMLRFSAKEAIYKAIDPYLWRYVAFGEVEVRPREDGSAGVVMLLRTGERFEEGSIEVRWLRRDGVILTTARAAPPSGCE